MDNWSARRPNLASYGRQLSYRSQQQQPQQQQQQNSLYSGMSPATTPMEERPYPPFSSNSPLPSTPNASSSSPAPPDGFTTSPSATPASPSFPSSAAARPGMNRRPSYNRYSPAPPPTFRGPAAASSSFMTSSSTPLGTVMAARRPTHALVTPGATTSPLPSPNPRTQPQQIPQQQQQRRGSGLAGSLSNQPPLPTASLRSSDISEDIQAKMKAFSLSRRPPSHARPTVPMPGVGRPSVGMGHRASPPPASAYQKLPSSQQGTAAAAVMGGQLALNRSQGRSPPLGQNQSSEGDAASGGLKLGGGLAAKRGVGLKLSDAHGPGAGGVPNVGGVPGATGVKKGPPAAGGGGLQRKNRPMGLPGMGGGPGAPGGASAPGVSPNSQGNAGMPNEQAPGAGAPPPVDNAFSKFSEVIDTRRGTLNFKNKAIIHGGGIDFSSGRSFSISLDEVEMLDELGKGNYGTVYKVRHARPRLRKPGLGIRGTMPPTSSPPPAGSGPTASTTTPAEDAAALKELEEKKQRLSNVIMAMKEIRLELDDTKFTSIVMELDILHRCVSPFIIDFYGAFFQEGAVYICVEFMDGGSVEKLYDQGIPEPILKKITLSTIMGLKSLKDDHNIIHRDVKPTNILVNTRGQIKICDFGVSGNLVASIAKTNIGCQSYMAPERIAGGAAIGGSNAGTYSVQSDVWSLGLTVIECAVGRYPYPPETSSTIFSQLNAIVHGEPPQLPDNYSREAKEFVKGCLNKNADSRPTYNAMLRNPWLADLMRPPEEQQQQQGKAGTRADRSGSGSTNSSSAYASLLNTPSPSISSEPSPMTTPDSTSTYGSITAATNASTKHYANGSTAGTTHITSSIIEEQPPKPETAFPSSPPTVDTADEEVALWVRAALERRAAAKAAAEQPTSASDVLSPGAEDGSPVSTVVGGETDASPSSGLAGQTLESEFAGSGATDGKNLGQLQLLQQQQMKARIQMQQKQQAAMAMGMGLGGGTVPGGAPGGGIAARRANRPALHAVALDQVPGTQKDGSVSPEHMGGIF